MSFWSQSDFKEPLRSHRWYLEFTGKLKNIQFALKECKKPEYEVSVTEHKRINHIIRLPGLLKWKPITVKFASIRGQGDKIDQDAAVALYKATVAGGYSSPRTFLESVISKDTMHSSLERGLLNLVQLDPNGNPIEVWSLYNAFLSSVSFGTLSYESEDIVNIDCTITYDWAVLNDNTRVQRFKQIVNHDLENKFSDVIKEQAGKNEKSVFQESRPEGNVVSHGDAQVNNGRRGFEVKFKDVLHPKDTAQIKDKAQKPIKVSTPYTSLGSEFYDESLPDDTSKATRFLTPRMLENTAKLTALSRQLQNSKPVMSEQKKEAYKEFSSADTTKRLGISSKDAGMDLKDNFQDASGKEISVPDVLNEQEKAQKAVADAQAAAQAKAKEAEFARQAQLEEDIQNQQRLLAQQQQREKDAQEAERKRLRDEQARLEAEAEIARREASKTSGQATLNAQDPIAASLANQRSLQKSADDASRHERETIQDSQEAERVGKTSVSSKS